MDVRYGMQGASKIVANLTSGIVNNKIFKDRTRKRPEDFTRKRKMSFEHLVFFIQCRQFNGIRLKKQIANSRK